MAPGIPHLKRRSDYLRVARAGLRCATPGLVLQTLRRTEADGETAAMRLGITASRRVGGAVERNRARRRLRAAAELVLPLHAKAGYDYVLIGRAATVARPFGALIGDLTTALKRLRAYRGAGAEGRSGKRGMSQ